MKLTRKRLAAGASAFGFLALFCSCQTPADAVITVNLSGSAAASFTFQTGATANATLTTVSGVTGSPGITAPATDTNSTTNPTYTVNYGGLAGGDGTNEVAQIPLRIRANTSMHISAAVSSVSMTNLSYMGTDVSGSSLANATFIGLGNATMTVGNAAQATTTGASYNTSIWPNTISALPPYAAGATLAALTSNATPLTGSTQLASFSSAPSKNGGAQNYVEMYALLAAPTGYALGPTDPSSNGTFSATLAFDAFTAP